MSDVIELTQVGGVAGATARIGAYFELTKPRIAGMVVVTAAAGFLFAQPFGDGVNALRLASTLAGVALVGGGANALNQYLEAEFDRLMRRTERRPIPTGRLSATETLAFGVGISSLGLIVLMFWSTPSAALLTAMTLAIYVFVYTPLKRTSPLCVYAGAVPGALPPVIGWASAVETLSPSAWLLFAIMFFWQLPHFAAIAWQYRNDYERGGYPMLSVGDPDGLRTSRHLTSHAVALVFASLLPACFALVGWIYAVAAMALGAAFLVICGIFVWRRSRESARAVVVSSVVYLPLLLAALVMDRSVAG